MIINNQKNKNIEQYGEFEKLPNPATQEESHGLLSAALQVEKANAANNGEPRDFVAENASETAEKSAEDTAEAQEKISEDSAETAEELPVLEETKEVSFEEFFGLDTFESLENDEDKAENLSSKEIRKQLEADKAAVEAEKRAIKQRIKEEERAEKKQARANRVKNPIGAKLIGIVSVLLLFALAGVTATVSYFTTEDIQASSEENNLSTNARTLTDTENRLTSAVSAVGMLFDLLKTAGDNETEIRALESMFFSRNGEIAAVFSKKDNQIFVNDAFFALHEKEKSTAEEYFAAAADELFQAQDGDIVLKNASPFFGIPVLSLFYLHEDDAVGVLYSAEKMLASFSAGSVNQSFLVNEAGELLVHSDVDVILEGASERENPIVKAMRESAVSNSQILFRADDGEEYIGAFRKLSNGSGAVITTVKMKIMLEGVRATTRRNVYITLAILSVAIMIVYFFAQSLARPLKALTAVANEINKGNFNTDLFSQLNYKGRDEIGVLEKSTRNELDILNTVSKLTNKGVTKAVITREIDFEPHLKDITIFFSDIRGFTAISDGFKNRFGEKSAAEIIGFLNDYMSRMVQCISLTGGVVDKFEGDAIMACWGVLRNDDLSWENKGEMSVTRALRQEAHSQYVKADALSAITCCIAMRYSLAKYNKDAAAFTEAHKDEPLAQYKPHIRIGAGLNSGRATVGFMGSFEKMEFTSIGDAVNFASRTEASNKPCGTDILITEDTYNLLKYDYIRCIENDFSIRPENRKYEITVEKIPVGFEVKGKGIQHFYGVVNMPRFDIESFFKAGDPDFEVDADCEKVVGPFGPRTLKEMREMLGIAEPNFGQVNLNEEENKIQMASV